jgi:regulatory protein
MPRNPPQRLDADALREYAVRLLAGRAHSIGELRYKLQRRAADAGEVDAVLSRLKEHGYLDDRRFAEGYAEARRGENRFGRARVLRDLRGRRVAPALAEHTVERVYSGVDEEALIEDFLRRKYRTAPREGLFQDEKDLASAYRKLARAGFRTGDIVRVLKRFAKNPELLDGFEPPEEAAEE